MDGTLIDEVVGIAAGLQLERVPAVALQQAGYVIADAVSVSRGGARQPEFQRLVELAYADGTVGSAGESDFPATTATGNSLRASTVFSTPICRTSPEYAAFLNATAGSFLELDEGMRPTGHPAMQLVMAALAVAEQNGASGRALLQAVLAGYETTSRLFKAFRLRYPVHPHGHLGAIGAAVAVALLKGTDPLVAARIAGTTPILSIWNACYEGASARNTWMGLAAQSGVRASTLVQAGFTGSASMLEVAFGELVGDLVDEDVLRSPLSYDQLGIRSNYFKLHSACALSHAAIDAVLELKDGESGTRLQGRRENIEHILVETVSNNMKLNRQAAPNNLSARFSLPYAVAAAWLLGRSDPDAFNYRPEVAELAERVEIKVADDLEADWPQSSPARVTVYFHHRQSTVQVQNPRGHHSQPISETQLRAKFGQLVQDPQDAEIWWNNLNSLEQVADSSTLFRRQSA